MSIERRFATISHEDLCQRALRWLSGTRRCAPVFSGIASCAEIPDAIGWSSKWDWCGSTVVECKTSRSDFYSDQKKYQRYVQTENVDGYAIRHAIRHRVDRMTKQWAEENGYRLIDLARMGDYRFFMCEPGIITDEMVSVHAPDHGLLWVEGRRVRIMRQGERRKAEMIDKDAEIRYLRFAIINDKMPASEILGESLA